MLKLIGVGMAQLEVSRDVDAVLVAYSLGSCLAVVVHDPNRRVGSMIHYMLPLSSINPEKAETQPAMFADTGVPLLFERMYQAGSRKRDLVVKVAGGSRFAGDDCVFDIGRRNYVALRKMFWKNGVTIAAEDVGGARSRTVRLYVATGRVSVATLGVERDL